VKRKARVSRKVRFAAWLQERFFLRFHMALILSLAFAAGLVITKAFLNAGNTNLALRYGVAVVVSYVAFLAGLRLWLWYVAGGSDTDGEGNLLDTLDVIDAGSDLTHVVGDAARAEFAAGGGQFGGGGASGSFGESAADGVASLVTSDEDGCAVGVVLAVAALVFTVLLAGLYLIYAAPAILAEAAFQALLAPALIPAMRRADREGWIPRTIRATAIPFAVMLIAAVGFGLAAAEMCPGARRMADVIACART
jgi:uncharacterized membrane protein (DUF485 family)